MIRLLLIIPVLLAIIALVVLGRALLASAKYESDKARFDNLHIRPK